MEVVMDHNKNNIENGEVIAAIAAAIAYMSRKTGTKIVVRSFRRIPQSSPIWNVTGRIELINDKLS